MSLASPGGPPRRIGAASVASGSKGGGAGEASEAGVGSTVLGSGLGSTALDDATVRSMIEFLRKTIKLKGFTPSKWNDDHDSTATRFLTDLDQRKLVAYMSAEGELVLLTGFSSIPVFPKSFFYWVKTDYERLSPKRIKTGIQHGLVTGGGLDALLRVLGDVYLPAAQVDTQWPEVVQRDLLTQMHK